MGNDKKTEQADSNGSLPGGSAKKGRKTILELKTTITWKNCAALRKKVDGKMQQGHTEVILDFKQVDFFDSAALETLIQIHDDLMKGGGILKMAGLNEVCMDILLATRIINILFVYKDINEAISHKKT